MALSPANSARGGFPLGLEGAAAATRYVGAVASGAPLTGTFAVGDFVIGQDGTLRVCTVAGSPGTWTAISGAAAAVDPVQELFGTPTGSAFEFATSSLAGLTALSPTPDVENADTSVPDAYFVQDNLGTTAWCGRYLAAPAAPFTVITKILDDTVRADFNGAAVFIGEATPGVMELIQHTSLVRDIKSERFTNPTTFSSTLASTTDDREPPLWLALRVNSATSVDYLYSSGGWVWVALTAARNPAITIASVGIAGKSENTGGSAAAFEFLRVWTSALTFPAVA